MSSSSILLGTHMQSSKLGIKYTLIIFIRSNFGGHHNAIYYKPIHCFLLTVSGGPSSLDHQADGHSILWKARSQDP